MKNFINFFCLFMMLAASVFAQDDVPASAWGNTTPLHVEGKYFVDQYGNKVVLHGVMDTPNTYFNGGRWSNNWSYNDAAISNCRTYFGKLFKAITFSDKGAYCNVFRLHLDPCWTNDNSYTYVQMSQTDGGHIDPHGNKVSQEADICHFNPERLEHFVEKLFVPLATTAIKRGLYIIMRPPGVFPGYVEVGDYYNKYLMDVWDIVSRNKTIQQYSGQIMIELGNEPVTLRAKNGASSDKALHDFFQPIVDKIRSNGFKGIILGVGTGYQSSYEGYAKYPLEDDNLGYAVHVYSGWYGASDEHCDHQSFINQFAKQVPVVNTHPIMVTEIDWSPGGAKYTTNPDGSLKSENYGTWATGTTSKWGKAWRAVHDYYGNIGMTLTGTGDYLDIDDFINKNKVTPAFKYAMEAKGVDPMEACGQACFTWYKEWAGVNYARPDLLSVETPLAKFNYDAEDGSVITCMEGQRIDYVEGTFGDGMTSRIPIDYFDIQAEASDVCAMSDGALVAKRAGVAAVPFVFKGKGGSTLPESCKLDVLPAFSINKHTLDHSIVGSGEFVERRSGLKTSPNGMGGWVFGAGLDVSPYNYLVFKFLAKPKCAAVLYITDSDDIEAPCYTVSAYANPLTIDLKEVKRPDGTPIDLKNIKKVAFKTNGSEYVYLKDVFLSNDGETSATSAKAPSLAATVCAEECYNAAGQRIAAPQKGINIIRQTLSDGTKKTVKVIVP